MSFDETVPLADPRAMRALAHPVRLRIRDLLDERGPLTATQLSEQIDESPASCSFHLRTLAKYGFIEEAGGGKGRNRPWRVRRGGLRVEPGNLSGEARDAALAMGEALRAALFGRISRWVRQQPTLPEPWRGTGFEMQFDTWMTPDELAEVSRRFAEVLAPFRTARERPADARRVTVAAQGFPQPDD